MEPALATILTNRQLCLLILISVSYAYFSTATREFFCDLFPPALRSSLVTIPCDERPQHYIFVSGPSPLCHVRQQINRIGTCFIMRNRILFKGISAYEFILFYILHLFEAFDKEKCFMWGQIQRWWEVVGPTFVLTSIDVSRMCGDKTRVVRQAIIN